MSGHHKWSELKQKSRRSLTRYAHDEYGYISEDGKRLEDEPPMCLASEVEAALLAAREDYDRMLKHRDALLDGFRQRAEAAEASLSRLREHALKVLKGFRDGVFVRNISGDNASDWAIKALPYISALAHLEVEAKRLLATEPQTEKP